MSHCVPAKINFMRLLLLRMKMLKSEMLCFLSDKSCCRFSPSQCPIELSELNQLFTKLSGLNEQKVWIQLTKSRTMKHGRLTLEIDNILSGKTLVENIGKNLSRKHWGKQWEKALCPIELSELNKLLRVVWIQWTKSLDAMNKKTEPAKLLSQT